MIQMLQKHTICLEIIKSQSTPSGVVEVLLQSSKKNPQQSHGNKLRWWTVFCNEFQIDYIESTINNILIYVLFLKFDKLICNKRNSIRSILSVSIKLVRLNAGKYPMISL